MQKHSHLTPEGRAFWYTERLWALSEALPEETVPLDSIPEFDQNCWFSELPTCKQVAEHARRILDADLSYPILLSSDGHLIDGGHRLARAWLEGKTEVKARRFVVDPEPNYVTPESATA